jgi:outer membrane protein assembly factor BamB
MDGKLIWKQDMIDDEHGRLERDALDRLRTQLKRDGISGVARPRTAASDGTTIFLPFFDKSRRLVAMDLETGERRWSFQATGMIYGTPTLTDDKVFFGTNDGDLGQAGHFSCINKTNMTVLWTFPTKSKIDAGSSYRDGSVFFSSCDGRCYRVNAVTGKEVWSYQTPQSQGMGAFIYSAPQCTEDAVYFGSFDGYLYCLRIESGELKWRIQPVKDSEVTSCLLADGRRIVLAIRRNLGTKQGQDAIVVIGEDEKARGK